ncbi:MAG: hypothetical protein O3B25_09800, partial [Verrucomicrobia bacterium]|nr:hypothetical protein [Verrucomicrobiota bacterium]
MTTREVGWAWLVILDISGVIPQGCHCEPQRGAAIQRNRHAGCMGDASPLYGVEWRGRYAGCRV